ncbi:MAG: type II/IV secretion system protein, partial [Bdellovibrionales bacterium]|nr:type II/IV secretion system protein [Bdellovibrionales bacterium]
NSEVINFVNKVLMDGIISGASDIHLEPFKNKVLIRQRVDGTLQLKQYDSQFTFNNYQAIAARLKIISTLDISERRLPQDGGFNLKDSKSNVYFRISILPTCFGERIVLRILRPDIGHRSIESIGFNKKDLINFTNSISSPQGMVLVTGPTGSGKTTTLYSSINYIKSEGTSILTVEDPVECYIEGVSQVALNENIGLTFTEILKSFLRQDPEALLIGEIRDKKTVDIAIKASLTGHLVLSTLHTNDAPSTIIRLRNMEVPNYLIAASVNCIVAQRLAKKICQQCKVIDKTFSDKIKNHLIYFEQNGINKSYLGHGCNGCNGTGIQGRQAIYEVLNVNSEIKETIINDGSKKQIIEVAKKSGFISISEAGISLVREGIITVDEYCKVLLLN